MVTEKALSFYFSKVRIKLNHGFRVFFKLRTVNTFILYPNLVCNYFNIYNYFETKNFFTIRCM